MYKILEENFSTFVCGPEAEKKLRRLGAISFAEGLYKLMKIVNEKLTLDELKEMAASTFGNMVKAAVDVEKGG